MYCVEPFTNKRYKAAKIKQCEECQYCGEETQDFEHLYEQCETVKAMRDRLAARWEHKPTTKTWVVGTGTKNAADRAMTFIAIELNHYIHMTNWKNEELSIKDFKSRLRGIEVIERRIAEKKHKTHTHEAKWKDVFQLLS